MGEAALGWGLGGAAGLYASPSEFGVYLRVSVHFGLDGSLGRETGVAIGGLSGFAVGAGGGGAVSGSGALGVPSLSRSGAVTVGASIPLSATVFGSYTRTFPVGRCK